MTTFIGKTALITGGGTGIGRAIALRLAADGAMVVVAGRRCQPLQETVESIQVQGGQAHLFTGDVAHPDDNRRMVEFAAETFGRLDILVNNAAINLCALMPDITPESWDQQLNVNLRGPFFTAQSAMPVMAKNGGGNIINIASVSAQIPHPWTLVYCVSKAGMIQLTRCLAQAGAEYNVRVNSVSPGIVDTPIHYDNRALEDVQAQFTQAAAQLPRARIGKPDDIAGIVRYLASDEADWITGCDFVIDGGKLNLR